MAPYTRVITLVADGVRSDTLAAAMRDGTAPALARVRDEGAFRTVTSVFPSVTGPAYVPFLLGVHPADAGVPGLRWFDRSRTVGMRPGNARSYVGMEMGKIDRDLDPRYPTMFEHEPSIGAFSVVRRGLARGRTVGDSAAYVLRGAATHFRGDVSGWLDLDRRVARDVVAKARDQSVRYVFAAFTGIDKVSHAEGHGSPRVHEALRIVDHALAALRDGAERAGAWDDTLVMVVSDHGHSPVHAHHDLARHVRSLGFRVLAHPNVFTRHADVAVMVSGNAMAHVYVELERRVRPMWDALSERWGSLLAELLAAPATDLALLPLTNGSCRIVTAARGIATVRWNEDTFLYEPEGGDPLALGVEGEIDANDAYDRSLGTDYPDALLQIARISSCARSGDIILSAARDHDFREWYEPIPHVSSHGAMHREHMLVPLLSSRPFERVPRRTADTYPIAREFLKR